MLKQQPRVGIAFQKELHYFDLVSMNKVNKKKFAAEIWRKPNNSRVSLFSKKKKYLKYVVNPEVSFTDEWYRNIFVNKPVNKKRSEQGVKLVYAEASPSYMMMPDSGIDHMARLLPDIKPILMVRDPVKRMVSGTSMVLARNPERQEWSFEKHASFLRKEQAPRGDYRRAIKLFREKFDDIHIIPFGQIYRDSISVMRKVEELYGLDRITYKNLQARKNSYTGKVVLSEEVMAEIVRLCAPQYEYLKSEFGADFLSEI